MKDFEARPPSMEVQRIDKVALIDADFLKHYLVNNISKLDIDFDLPTPMEIFYEEADSLINKILFGVECKNKVFLFSGKTKDTFRAFTAVTRKYKGDREKRPPKYPFAYEDMQKFVQYVRGTQQSILYPDIEADDLLGILQGPKTFIYSHDKDAKQIPGTHFDIKSDTFITISEDEAWEFLMTQCLEGDSVDAIPGLPGHGPKSTPKVFKNISPHGMHYKVMELYMNKYGRRVGFDMFVEQYSLLRVLLDRGDHLKEKYAAAINLIKVLTI